MKKIILSLFCLLIISCGISCVCASSDMANATQHQDFLQNDAQNVAVDNTAIDIDQNSTASSIENITADDNNAIASNETDQNNATMDNSSSVSNNTTNGPKLDIKGPKLNSNDPNLAYIYKCNYWETVYHNYCAQYGVGDRALYELIYDYLTDPTHGNTYKINKDDVFLIGLVTYNHKFNYIEEQMKIAYNFLKSPMTGHGTIGTDHNKDRDSRRMF